MLLNNSDCDTALNVIFLNAKISYISHANEYFMLPYPNQMSGYAPVVVCLCFLVWKPGSRFC